jgi:hypothetical protein
MSSFHKGQQLLTTATIEGVRPMTPEEQEAWYKDIREKCGPLDSAGEPWVCSGTKYLKAPAGAKLGVTRARCSAQVGWSEKPGYVEVVDLTTGEHFKVKRDDLVAGLA